MIVFHWSVKRNFGRFGGWDCESLLWRFSSFGSFVEGNWGREAKNLTLWFSWLRICRCFVLDDCIILSALIQNKSSFSKIPHSILVVPDGRQGYRVHPVWRFPVRTKHDNEMPFHHSWACGFGGVVQKRVGETGAISVKREVDLFHAYLSAVVHLLKNRGRFYLVLAY